MAYTSGYQGQLNPSLSVSIASGQQVSSIIDCGGFTLCGVIIPAAFTGTAITFQMCDTIGGTFVPVTGVSGSALSYTVAAGKYYAIDPKDFFGIRYLEIKSGSAEGAARTLVCALKGF